MVERKALFARYRDLQRDVEREERIQQAAKARQDFLELLRQTPTITGRTRYSEVLEQLEQHASFQAVTSPQERATLFEDYVAVRRREQAEASRDQRRRATEKYQKLLESLTSEIRIDTPWRTALLLLKTHPSMISDEDLCSMESIDLLLGFENHIKYLERQTHRDIIAKRQEQQRQERLARQSFRKLLVELTAKGLLTATTGWKQLFPLIQDRPELAAAIAQPGSTPLDLFWDHLHDLQADYVPSAKLAVEILHHDHGNKGQEGEAWLDSITAEQISLVSKQLELSTAITSSLLAHLLPASCQSLVSGSLSPEQRLRISHKVDELRRDRRRQIDRLKSCIKRFQPPIQLDSSFRVVGPLIRAQPEGAEIGDDEVILYYFDKYIRHLRKKAGLIDGDQKSDPE